MNQKECKVCGEDLSEVRRYSVIVERLPAKNDLKWDFKFVRRVKICPNCGVWQDAPEREPWEA